MTLSLRFKPVSHSWVALHPNPKGVIQFVGGAFFGTFGPMVFYRHLLNYFYEQSYSIVLLPFAFTFNHYREAGFLAQEQYRVLPELVRMALMNNYPYEVYLHERNYVWMGHSVGCKYISLLEGLSALPTDKEQRDAFICELLRSIQTDTSLSTTERQQYPPRKIQRVIQQINILVDTLKQDAIAAKNLVEAYIQEYAGSEATETALDFTNIFIRNQPSILLAPDISDTSSAIRPKALAHLIDRLGLGVKPDPATTHALIKKSNLFNLLGLVCFKSDNIASETCHWFTQDLGKPPEQHQKRLTGGHLRPLGIDIGDVVFNPLLDPLATTTDRRNLFLESHIADLLKDLGCLCPLSD
ncbi:DUF1350 family protein [Leptothoe kymatousa]|uniref:DUF1350 family protein n=1 Tax=Leptothoe kymatousa TAU-MAC 1615 TaxID=2364775 RepID=A0ABS5Y3J3_9CYAN|nr:DUF1350 family protein [Leptothoe kymatousa]MBT9312408.1 DUF1350 family protein [Leptothoe kymatousa TAU-MAC 1615]